MPLQKVDIRMNIVKNNHKIETAWCPGCGNFGILSAFKKAFFELSIPSYNIVMVSGIGQAGKLPHYIQCNLFNGLHGRTLPVATAIKLANNRLNVFAVGGDGDGYGEGGNHIIHAIRRNISVKYFVHNNQIYGLTKGQASPTSDMGFKTKSTPKGVILNPFNPIAVALATGAGFIARGFAGDIPHLVYIIKEAIKHKGFTLTDILQPCVSFNHVNTFSWYRKRLYKLNEKEDYDTSNKMMAFEKAQEWGDRIPIGIFYIEDKPAYEERISVIQDLPLIKHEIKTKNFEELCNEFL